MNIRFEMSDENKVKYLTVIFSMVLALTLPVAALLQWASDLPQ